MKYLLQIVQLPSPRIHEQADELDCRPDIPIYLVEGKGKHCRADSWHL